MEANTPAPDLALPLEDIQGNLAGFFKHNQRFVLLRFPDKAKGQDFVASVIREVDSCADVLEFRDRFRPTQTGEQQSPTSKWLNLLLSCRGLEILEAPDLVAFEEVFRQGMRARASQIGDVDGSAPEHWTSEFSGDIHAVAVLAADSPEDIDALHTQLRRHTQAKAHPIEEVGFIEGAARPGEEKAHEHFGFFDGLSQPGIEGITADAHPGQEMIAAGEFIFGYAREGEAAAAPAPAGYGDAQPPPTPGADRPHPSWAMNGSLVVLRRLNQDVLGFKEFIRKRSAANGISEDLLAAKLIGRYRSGAPLERTHTQDPGIDPDAADPSIADPTILEPDRVNDFDYDADTDGRLVPRAAHIRKTYPRSQIPPGKQESERRRILRRGIPFGPELNEGEAPYGGAGAPPPDQDRGLVFVCYQSSIAEQFEFIQKSWANSDAFPEPGDGRDPIISQDTVDPQFHIPSPGDLHLSLKRWVITTGGEYLISPSISSLAVLAGIGEES